MAKILLEIGADASQAGAELSKTANDFTKLSSVSKKTNEDIKKGLDDVANTAKKANDEMSNPKPTETQKRQLTAIQQLKKEIRDYESAAIKAGEGTAEFAKNIALAGQKKADLKDLKEAITALDPDSVAKSFLGLASSIAGGFSVAQSAVALTGVKSEELEKTLLKVQAAQALLAGLQQLANTQDELGKAKIIILNKLNTIELERGIVATQGATIAQRIYNVAVSGAGGPFALLAGAITIVVGIIAAYISQTGVAAEAEKIRSTAIDGTIIKNKELRDEYNKAINTLKDVEDQYKVLNGQLTEFEANLAKVERANKQAVDAINAETKAKIVETGGFWNDFFDIIKSGNNSGVAVLKRSQEVLKIEADAAQQLKVQAEKNKAEIAQANLEADKKAADEKKRKDKEANDKSLQAEKDFQAELKSLREKAAKAEIEGLQGSEKIRAIEQEQLAELEIYKQGFIAKAKLTNSNFQLSKEQLEQFAIIENGIRLKANQDILAIEKSDNDKLTEQIKQGLEDKKNAREKAFSDELKRIENQDKAIVLQTKEGSKERLDAEIKEIKDVADFKKTQAGLSADEVIIIEREALNKIADLQKEFASKNKFDVFKLLGLDVKEGDKEKILSELNKIAASAKQFTDQIITNQQRELDARRELNEEALKSNDDKLSELQKQLDLELRANEQGLASNVDAVRREIEETKAAKQAALEEEKRIAAEQQKIKQRQIVLDSLGQVSSLLTAGATLFAQGAFTGPVGIISSIATIAAMVASFIALKDQLKQFSNPGFKEGGYTGDYGVNQVAGHVHGQEFVSDAKTTKKHRPLLEALHSENYSGLSIEDISPLIKGIGVTFNPDVLDQISTEGKNYQHMKESKSQELHNTMKSVNKNLSKFFNHVKNKPEGRTLPDGRMMTKIGNTIRITRQK